MTVGKGKVERLIAGGSLLLGAAGCLLAGSALAAPRKAKPISFSVAGMRQFTPANADPRLAAALSGKASALGAFQFTPAASKSAPRQVRVAVRAQGTNAGRALASDPTGSAALTPASYNLGAAVGWKRFALAGAVADVDNRANPAIGRESSAQFGVSYDLKKRVSTRVALGAETRRPTSPALTGSDAYSVDLGTAIKLSRRIAVTGGVRYRVEQDKARTLSDERRDSQAVYVGTAFKF